MGTTPRAWRAQLDGSLLLGSAMGASRLLHPLLRLARVDLQLFRTLLEMRLTLDLKGDARAPRSSGAAVGPTLVVLAAWLGGLLAGIVALVGPPMLFMIVAHSLLMFGLGILLLLQLSQILVDPTDIEVLSSRPVDGRTLFAARLAHAFMYVLILSAAFSMFPVLLGCIGMRTWQPLVVFPLSALLSGSLTLGLVALLHAACLRLLGPVRFQGFVLWIQIGVLSVMMGGNAIFQGLIRIIPVQRIVELTEGRPMLLLLFPPAHYAGLLQVSMGDLGSRPVALASLALLLPGVLSILAVFLASKHYLAGLRGELNLEGRSPRWPDGLVARLGQRLCKTPVERAGFVQGWALSMRDRLFMRTAYPAMGMLAIPVLGLSLSMIPQSEPEGSGVMDMAWTLTTVGTLLMPYIFGFMGTMLMEVSWFTETPEARWIMRLLPGERLAEHLRGVTFALLLRVVVPLTTLAVLIQLAVIGSQALYDIPLSLVGVVGLNLMTLPLLTFHVPFTHKPQPGEMNTHNLLPMLHSTGLCLLAAGLHALLYFLVPGWARLALALVLMPFIPKLYRGLSDMKVLPMA